MQPNKIKSLRHRSVKLDLACGMVNGQDGIPLFTPKCVNSIPWCGAQILKDGHHTWLECWSIVVASASFQRIENGPGTLHTKGVHLHPQQDHLVVAEEENHQSWEYTRELHHTSKFGLKPLERRMEVHNSARYAIAAGVVLLAETSWLRLCNRLNYLPETCF